MDASAAVAVLAGWCVAVVVVVVVAVVVVDDTGGAAAEDAGSAVLAGGSDALITDSMGENCICGVEWVAAE
ncbi:hypothetical protein BST31_17490 [Mycobacterium marseillense]|nr:hypothetical protein BST31_17490 [Mycobacterium marseillense]